MPSSRTTRRSPGASERTRSPLNEKPASGGARWTGSPGAVARPAGRKRSAPIGAPRDSVGAVRWWRALGAVVVCGLVVAGVAVARPEADGLRFADGTPRDLRVVAAKAWQRFSGALPACAGRLGTITVGVAWELADRARYEPGPALVRGRAPGTAANLEASLLHEFAHHAERRCGLSASFRRRFTAAGRGRPRTPRGLGPTSGRTA